MSQTVTSSRLSPFGLFVNPILHGIMCNSVHKHTNQFSQNEELCDCELPFVGYSMKVA